MGKFKREEGFGGKKRFDGNRGFNKDGRSERPEMHRAVCSECGESCEVPFRPTGDKPVFCSICFGNKDTSNKSRNERRTFARQGSGGEKTMFRAVCDKCHKDCEVPFRPSGDKPVFCSDCFGRQDRNDDSYRGSSSSTSSVSSDQNKKQCEMLNAKLDSILKMLTEKNRPSEKPASEIIKEVEVKKAEPQKAKVEKKTAKKTVAKKSPAKKKAVAPKKTVKKTVAKKKK